MSTYDRQRCRIYHITYTYGLRERPEGNAGFHNDREPICRGPRSTESASDLANAKGSRMQATLHDDLSICISTRFLISCRTTAHPFSGVFALSITCSNGNRGIKLDFLWERPLQVVPRLRGSDRRCEQEPEVLAVT